MYKECHGTWRTEEQCTPQRQRIKKRREQRAREGYALNLKRSRIQINIFIGKERGSYRRVTRLRAEAKAGIMRNNKVGLVEQKV